MGGFICSAIERLVLPFRPNRHRHGEKGTSLVEVVVAVVILGIMSTAVLAVILKTQASGVSNRSRVAAANLAAREIDMVRDEFTRSDVASLAMAAAGTQTNPHPRGVQVAGDPFVIDGTSYTVVRSVGWNITGNGASACSGGSLVVYPTLGVTVSVTWPHMGSVRPVVSTAALAPAKGNGIPGTDSFVAVKVIDSFAHASVGRTVTVTGGSVTKTGTTDASGCAVVQVSPAVGVGTDYVARVTDAGYVDTSGTTGPSKAVGKVTQGQLNNTATFSYERAATLKLRIVDSSGTLVDSALVGGAVTLVPAVLVGGANPTVPANMSVITVPDLWPMSYGAFYGATSPPGGYNSVLLVPGGTSNLNVSVEMASSLFTGLPAGTTQVIAVPGTASTCPAGARVISASEFGGFSIFPGAWSFFATGGSFDCSQGPSGYALSSGPNAAVAWDNTSLKVNGAIGGTLWAVNLSKVSGPLLTTCPGSAFAGVAVNVDGARSGTLALPAGTWYVYRTNGAADGTCLGTPVGLYPLALSYGVANTLAWASPSASVSVTYSRPDSNWTLRASPSSTNCKATGSGGFSKSGTTYTATLAPGTWTIFSTNNGNCQAKGGTVVVGGQTAYSLAFNSTTPPTVGP